MKKLSQLNWSYVLVRARFNSTMMIERGSDKSPSESLPPNKTKTIGDKVEWVGNSSAIVLGKFNEKI